MWGEISGETIKSAISLKITNTITAANPSIKIYKEKIVENFKKPCFFIWTMDVSHEKQMRNNYERTYQMNIRYHINENIPNKYEILCSAGNALMDALKEINVPVYIDDDLEELRPVFGKKMSYKIDEGVLQMFVTYIIKTKAWIPKVPDMQTLDINNY